MMLRRHAPIHTLPHGYQEVRHWQLDAVWIIIFNVIAIVPLAVAIVVMTAWARLIGQLRDESFNVGADFPFWLGLVIIIASLGVHEALHGVAMQFYGHRPRFGAKWRKMVLYTTADNALFRRGEYIFVSLLPLVGMTLAGMIVMALFFTEGFVFYVALAVILNAASSIGDLWMTGIVLRYPVTALIRDEAEGIRIYAMLEATGSVTGS